MAGYVSLAIDPKTIKVVRWQPMGPQRGEFGVSVAKRASGKRLCHRLAAQMWLEGRKGARHAEQVIEHSPLIRRRGRGRPSDQTGYRRACACTDIGL